MMNSISRPQLIFEILLNVIFLLVGLIVVVATKGGWNFFLNMEGERSFFWQLLGKRVEKYAAYVFGILLIVVAGIMIVQRLILLAGQGR
ncbi:MAG: hypothetical protein LZF86_120025 [Nitrospira sp.]|nr:MAG: hypothetical protein LZF86_120025 [Nitrospira sp.]